MNHKTKDRLLTLGALGLICLGGFSTSGCAVTTTEPLAARTNTNTNTNPYSYSYSNASVNAGINDANTIITQCTTDFDCEMRDFFANRVEMHWNWKKVAVVAVGVVVAGYLYNRQQRNGTPTTTAQQPYDCGFAECRPVK